MAEIIIPLIGLGSMYILSNEQKKNNTINNNNIRAFNSQTNINKLNNNQMHNATVIDNSSKYNQHTDKYYNENNYSSISSQKNNFGVGNHEIDNVSSLTGNNMKKDDFTHNNMVPFFGSKIKGSTADNQTSQTLLDNKQGMGSQQFKKQESAPLFSPDNNVHNTYGMSNNSDFFQSRVNVGNNMANATLWEQQKVAPGLNLDYNASVNHGYNSGMNARDSWQPKTVDELRVNTNPKISYELKGLEGPADNLIKQMGSIGKVEKHLPEKYFNNDPSRWIKTTGLEKAQTQRGEWIMKDENRQSTNMEYYGNGGDSKNTSYSAQNFESSKKQNLQELPISNASMAGQGNSNNLPSYSNNNNNRSTTQNQLNFGPIGGLAQAILTPIQDILKPSKKENVIGNLRQSGNVSNVINNGYLLNKNDTPQVTNRQMYCEANNNLNIQGQNSNGYLVTNPQLLSNQRETTSINYTGNSNGSTNMGYKDITAANNQRNNNFKTFENHPNQGGTQMFNQNMNVNIYKDDNDRNNNRMWVSNGGPKMYNNTILAANCDRGLQTYDQKINNDRMNPDLLTAFKQNPYTQSLHSVA